MPWRVFLPMPGWGRRGFQSLVQPAVGVEFWRGHSRETSARLPVIQAGHERHTGNPAENPAASRSGDSSAVTRFLGLQSHPPAQGCQSGKSLKVLLLRECSGKLGVLQGVLPRVLNVGRQQKEHSREHSLEHPQFPEHSREHPPEHPREHFREHFQGFPTLAPL